MAREPVLTAMRPYLRRYLRYLADPHSGADLTETEAGLVPADDPARMYPVLEGGVVSLSDEAARAASEDFDRASRHKGRSIPSEDAFRALPREGLPGWPVGYWEQRAHSTAVVWDVLEGLRRQAGRPAVGVQGVAADITADLPYLAHGLDAGGFITLALSPYAGRFGLGAYPYSRYCRIQASYEALPLRAGLFDVVIFSGSLPHMTPEVAGAALARAVDWLKPDGHLLVTDTPDGRAVLDQLDTLGLRTRQRAIPRGGNPARLVRGVIRAGRTPPVIVAARHSFS
ncbi:MAG: class I SAM-dependent methyltransferase [Anaerolineales bacterium]